MLKQLPFKKDYLILGGAILLLIVSYKFAFERTFEAWHIHKQLSADMARSSDLSYQPAYLERKNNNLSKLINHYKVDTAAFRSNIINTISSIAEKENVKLSEVPLQDPFYNTDKFILQKLDFEGDFFALTTVLHQLQSVNGVGMVRAATYKVMRNRPDADETKKLVLEVYLELVK